MPAKEELKIAFKDSIESQDLVIIKELYSSHKKLLGTISSDLKEEGYLFDLLKDAISYNLTEVIDILLLSSCVKEKISKYIYDLLHLAISNNNHHAVAHLIKFEELNILLSIDEDFALDILYLAQGHHFSLTAELLKISGILEVVNKDNNKVLRRALERKNIKNVELLLGISQVQDSLKVILREGAGDSMICPIVIDFMNTGLDGFKLLLSKVPLLKENLHAENNNLLKKALVNNHRDIFLLLWSNKAVRDNVYGDDNQKLRDLLDLTVATKNISLLRYILFDKRASSQDCLYILDNINENKEIFDKRDFTATKGTLNRLLASKQREETLKATRTGAMPVSADDAASMVNKPVLVRGFVTMATDKGRASSAPPRQTIGGRI